MPSRGGFRIAEEDEQLISRGVSINTGAVEQIVMPHDPEAERSVLSAIIANDDVASDCMGDLRDDDFYVGRNRIVFGALRVLFDQHAPRDPVSIVDHLRSEGTLERAGGASYINELANNTFALVSWSHHREILKRDTTLRRMISASARITALAMNAPEDTREVAGAAEKLIYEASERIVRSSATSLEEAIPTVFADIEERGKSGSDFLGIATGYSTLDRYLMGMRPGQLIVVGARPAVGKTSFALNLAVQAAAHDRRNAGAHVALFSLEMSVKEIVQRILSSTSNIDHSHLVTGKVAHEEWPRLIHTSSLLSELDITIDDTPGTTVSEISAKARRILHGKDRGLIIVDYLQLLSSGTRRSHDTRANEVSEMSRGLKIMAKELNVPVVALSQLNRQVEGNTRRPALHDLRESGSIEQDADVVILLDKSTTDEEAQRSDRPDKDMTDFIIAKNRSGPTGIVHLGFLPHTTKFIELVPPKAEM